MDLVHNYVAYVATAFEAIGVLVMAGGFVYAMWVALSDNETSAYTALRQVMGKSILLGLEILVAADIIMTVTTEPTLRRVAVLGLVVLIRTFLSFSLEVELSGCWPWQQRRGDASEPHEVME